MATYKKFEDLDIWQRARKLSREIYFTTTEGTFAKDYPLRDQINRASGSAMDNVAEGFGRDGKQEFIQFLSYSKSSVDEVQSQLYRALDRHHIRQETFDVLYDQAQIIKNMIGGFMQYLKKSEIKGIKYKKTE
jgi:four helix bundle protein